MKISFKKMYFILGTLIISQQLFCMELEIAHSFVNFCQLSKDIQKTIVQPLFKHSNNKTNFQLVNKEWAKDYSIKSATLFNSNGDKNCCGLSPLHMTRILLCAAYNKNYDGVKNILENSNVLDLVEDRFPYFCIDTCNNLSYALSLRSIADHCTDDELHTLLDTYKIIRPQVQQLSGIPNIVAINHLPIKYNGPLFICSPSNLLMDALAGNSDAIEQSQDKMVSCQTISDALLAAVACNHGKCIKILLQDLAGNDAFASTFDNRLLVNTAEQNHLKALEALLASNCFNLNKINSGFNGMNFTSSTLLDEMSSAPNPNNEAISLLIKYGAKTKKQIEEEKKKEKERKKREQNTSHK